MCKKAIFIFLTIFSNINSAFSSTIKKECLSSTDGIMFNIQFKGELLGKKHEPLYNIQCYKNESRCVGVLIKSIDNLDLFGVTVMEGIIFNSLANGRYEISWGPYRKLIYLESKKGDSVILEESTGVYNDKFKKTDTEHLRVEVKCKD